MNKLLEKYSIYFHAFWQVEKEWLEFRARNELYLPSDPHWKGMEWRNRFSPMREDYVDRTGFLWSHMTKFEQYVWDPYWLGDDTIGYGFTDMRNMYELKLLMYKTGQLMEFGWPNAACSLIGHHRPLHAKGPRFTCPECWRTFDRDPRDDSVIVGDLDETWITLAAERFHEAFGSTGQA